MVPDAWDSARYQVMTHLMVPVAPHLLCLTPFSRAGSVVLRRPFLFSLSYHNMVNTLDRYTRQARWARSMRHFGRPRKMNDRESRSAQLESELFAF